MPVMDRCKVTIYLWSIKGGKHLLLLLVGLFSTKQLVEENERDFK